MQQVHTPVLLREVLEWLDLRPGGYYVDGTVGLGGHAEEILRLSGPDGLLLGTDRDTEALSLARARLSVFGERVRLLHADYRDLPDVVGERRPNAILLDLGASSLQLTSAERGFSFRQEGPLDMRMDRTAGRTAAEIVNRLPEHRLADLIERWGEEPAARGVARAIVYARRHRRIETTSELARVIHTVARGRRGHDPATRTFQALRIEVNREIEDLAATLNALAACLSPLGRLVVIAFHSLEDRAVKQTFRDLALRGFRVLTRKPVRPTPEEQHANPRSRSARLRVLLREAA